jgi:hypothetical protein
MYYEATWMRHSEYGVCHVTVLQHWPEDGAQPTNALHVRTVNGMAKVKPEQLTPWWPRAQAVQVDTQAVYIGRKAHRCMRKSACPDTHYVPVWGDVQDNVCRLLKNAEGMKYPTIAKAMGMLAGEYRDVVISRDIILTRVNDRVRVIFKGRPAGTLNNGQYEPAWPGHPLGKRVMAQLGDIWI